jgi:hypothetical protein
LDRSNRYRQVNSTIFSFPKQFTMQRISILKHRFLLPTPQKNETLETVISGNILRKQPQYRMLSNRDLNINRTICDSSNDQSKPIKQLAQTTSQLALQLLSIEDRIEVRLQSIANGEQFTDASIDIVSEFNQLKEDRFWRTEIETRLTEHLDELSARQLLRQEKLNAITSSTESSPAKRDALFAQRLVEQERAQALATRQREDQDEMSRILATCLHNEEENLRAEAAKDSKTKSYIARLMMKLKGKARRK